MSIIGRDPVMSVEEVVKKLDAEGGWDHETTGGWPDIQTWRALRNAETHGYVEKSTAYGAECWRLTEAGIEFRASLERRP